MNVSEALVHTMCLPFAPFMVQHLIGADDADPRIAYLQGCLVAAASLAEFVGSYPLGLLSDLIGRRPVILLALFATTICTPAFGFATSYEMAFAARTVRGLCAAVTGTTKTYLYEITDSSNRDRAFSVLMACYGFALCIGPTLGGALSEPARTWPSTFPNGSLFDRHPYALPCVVVAACSGAAGVCAWFMLAETVHRRSPSICCLDTQPLLDKGAADSESGDASKQSAQGGSDASGSAAGRGGSSALGRTAWLAAVLYGMVALVVEMIQVLWVLWAKLPLAQRGPHLDVRTIGLLQAVGGVGMLFSQAVLYPHAVRAFGLSQTFRLGWVGPVVAYVAIPFTVQLAPPEGGCWPSPFCALLAVLELLQMASSSALFTCVILMLSNSVPSGELGAANGVGQSIASMARFAAPLFSATLVGQLASGAPPLDVRLAFFAVAAFALLSVALSYALPRSIDHAFDGAASLAGAPASRRPHDPNRLPAAIEQRMMCAPLGAADPHAVALARERLSAEGMVVIDKGAAFSSADEVRAWSAALFSAAYDYTRSGAAARDNLGGGVLATTGKAERSAVQLLEHPEMSYEREYPGKLLFACFECPPDKAQTTLLETSALTRALRGTALWHKLEAHGLTYHFKYYSADEVGPGGPPPVLRPWQDFFGVRTRAELEAELGRRGMRAEWLQGEAGVVRVSQTLPAFELDDQGDLRVHFTLAVHGCKFDPDPAWKGVAHIDRPYHFTLGDGAELTHAELELVRGMYDTHRVLLPWVPGRLVVLDNQRWMHGRVAFALEPHETRKIGVCTGEKRTRRLV